MVRIISTSLLVLLVGVVVTPLAGPPSEAAAPLPAPGPERPLTVDQEEVVRSALELLDDGGFELEERPVVSFHADLADCLGNLAYWQVENGVDRIWVCWNHDDAGVQRIVRTQALVHELAHAWVHAHTSETARAVFMDVVGSSSWNGADHAWGDRGVEQAADLLTWAVLDPAVLFVDFDKADCAKWAVAYAALTGRSAPATVTGACGATTPG